MKFQKVVVLSVSLFAVTACTGNAGGGDLDDIVKAESGSEDGGDADAGTASSDEAGGVATGDRIGLGRLENEDLRNLLHTEIDKRVTKSGAVSDGAEESTELGDGETFQYTVVKLSRGLDDVSGDPSEVPDGIEVEINGWYKRTLVQKEAPEPEVKCMSFDTYAHLVKKAGKWVVPENYEVVFNREDSEDCY